MPAAPEMSTEPTKLALDQEKLRMVIYGDFGRGKTTFAGTFPRPLIIDTNGGLVSLALHGIQAERFEPTGHEDLEALYFWIKDRIDDFDTIVLDTLDSLCFTLMGEITEDAVDFKRADSKKVSLRMQFVPEQGDYYANQRQMDRFLKALRQLGKHIVVTSSLRQKGRRSAPNVSDGMEKVVCDWASVIGELVLADEPDDDEPYEPDQEGLIPDEGDRVLLVTESNSRATKSRFNSLKPYVVEPTFEKVQRLIEAEYAAATASKPKRRAPARGKR